MTQAQHLNITIPAAKTTRQPSKKLRKQVKDAFDASALIDICERDQMEFSDYATRYELEPDRFDGHERFFYFADNGSDVLAVAHLDSVQMDRLCQITNTAAGLLATSGALDDRLGVYVILEMLPKLGIVCDWLLTTDEEICSSTAEDFFPEKSWNWMISFDRGGTDVVMYNYETKELCGLVEDAGAQVGKGSFSDICQLEHLGCAGFNWGVGYQDYHGARAHAWLEDTFRMVARFVKFYRANADTKFEYEFRSYVADDDDGWLTSGGWSDPNDWYVTADCGHEVNMRDNCTFIDRGVEFMCITCGTIPDR